MEEHGGRPRKSKESLKGMTCFKQPLLTFAHSAKQAGNVDITDAAQASSAVRIVPFRTSNALGSGRSPTRNLQTAWAALVSMLSCCT